MFPRMFVHCLVALACCASAGAQQVMRQDLIDAYKRCLPKTNERIAREIFDSPDTIWYSHQSLPPMTQGSFFPNERFNGQPEGIRGVNSVYSNPGPNNRSNGNREFPWDLTLGGGSHNASNLKTVKAFLLPRDENGKRLPVVVFGSQPMRWCFPNNTIFAEVAFLVENKTWYPVEARFRVKEANDWQTSRLMPYQDRADLEQRVAETHPEIAKLIPVGIIRPTRVRAAHPRPSVNTETVMQDLPKFPKELTKRLLTGEFVSTEGWPYAPNADGPTTKEAFHIRPQEDMTAFHGTGERESCRRCHRDAGRHVRVFDMDREWYLSIRGSSGIMSFHPWPNNMSFQNGNPNRLRQSWLDHGVIARFNPKIHTSENYTRDAFLANELRRGVN